MKIHRPFEPAIREPEVIATFGRAQVVRHLDGTCELRGGSEADRGEALDWISLFMHEIVLRRPPRAKIVAIAQPDFRPRGSM